MTPALTRILPWCASLVLAMLLVVPFCNADFLWQMCMFGAREIAPVNRPMEVALLRAAARLSLQFAPDDTRRLSSLSGLADAVHADEYLKVQQDIIDSGTKILGPNHLVVAEALRSLQAHYASKPYEFHKMLEYGYRATDALEQSLGKGHPYVASSLFWMSQLCEKRDRADLSESFRRKALALRQNADWDYGGTKFRYMAALASLLETRGKYAESAVLYQRLIELEIKAGKAQEESLQETLKDAAMVQLRLGEQEEALNLFLQAAERAGKKQSSEKDAKAEKDEENAAAVSFHLAGHAAEDNNGDVIAAKLYALSEKAFRSAGDIENACKLQLDIVRNQVQHSHRPDASVVRQAREIVAKLDKLSADDPESLGDASAQMGTIYAVAGDPGNATTSFSKALVIAEKNHCPASKISSYRDGLTILHARQSQFERCAAMRKASRESELCAPSPHDDASDQLARFATLEQWDNAIALCKSEIQKLKSLEKTTDRLDFEIMLSSALTTALSSANRVAEAVSQCDSTLALLKSYAEQCPAEADYAGGLELDALAEKGSLCFAMGDLPAAREVYKQALVKHFDAAQTSTREQLLCAAGVTYREAGELGMAAQLYEQAKQLCRKNRDEMSNVYRTILLEQGALAMDDGNLNLARRRLLDGIVLFEQKSPCDQNLNDVFWIWYQRARFLLLENDVDNAVKLLRDAISLKSVMHESHTYEVQYARIQLAACLIKLHKDADARTELKAAIDGLKKIGGDAHYKIREASAILAKIRI